MPLLDHFHPPLHGPRRWEGFHHAWAANIAQHLNREVLPAEYFAESEISLGPTLEIDVATTELSNGIQASGGATATAVWAPTKPLLAFAVDFARLDVREVRVYEELGGAELRAAIELVSPANKDLPGSRLTFAAKCAGYLKHGVSVVVIDVVTERSANLHADLVETLEVPQAAWESHTSVCDRVPSCSGAGPATRRGLAGDADAGAALAGPSSLAAARLRSAVTSGRDL